MILLALGGFLLLFGVFVFFKKNEGETEISLLGAKLKSNNSAILLICLGALLATFGAKSLETTAAVDSKPIARTDTIAYEQTRSEQKGSDNTTPAPVRVVKDPAADLPGTWTMQETITGSEAVRQLQLASSEIPSGADISVHGDAQVTLLPGNDYNAETLISFVFKNLEGEQYELKYKLNYTGTWQMVGKQLVETISDGTVTPLSELAIMANSSSPATLADFNLQKGKRSAMDLVSLSAEKLVIKDPATGRLTTWRRKG